MSRHTPPKLPGLSSCSCLTTGLLDCDGPVIFLSCGVPDLCFDGVGVADLYVFGDIVDAQGGPVVGEGAVTLEEVLDDAGLADRGVPKDDDCVDG